MTALAIIAAGLLGWVVGACYTAIVVGRFLGLSDQGVEHLDGGRRADGAAVEDHGRQSHSGGSNL